MNFEKDQPRRDLPERTFEFAQAIVMLCQELDETPGVSRLLASQLLRAGTAIGANAEEAQAGQSKPDFIAKISMACKEARDTNYWLRLLAGSGILPSSRLADITDESQQLIAILTTILRNSKRSD
ncbi:MAG: four helix bundle protein [Verrucomicrobiales bacterium]